MDHRSAESTTGHRLRYLIESHKLEVGYSVGLFTSNLLELYQCISPSCISHTWTFIRNNNLSLEKRTDDILHQFQNYIFVMEYFIAAGIEGEILAELNSCFQAIHTTCRSDTATGNRKAISANVWKVTNT